MKKLLSAILMAVVMAFSANAQSAADLAKEQQNLNKILRKMLDQKPTKEAKKEAKKLEKQGWTVPAGDRMLANQITDAQLLGAELMTDENLAPTRRFIQHTAQATAGSYNAAFAAARANCQTEIASMIESKLVAAMQIKLDNAQTSAINATTVDKFNERVKSIVNQSLTNQIPVVTMYRVLPNNNYEVSVRLAYDKKEVQASIKRQLQKELEAEGDELNDIVDTVIANEI